MTDLARTALVGVAWFGLTVAPAVARQRPIDSTAAGGWQMPTMPGNRMMLSGIMRYRPPLTPFLPGAGIDPATLPAARPRQVIRLADGDTLRLDAGLLRKTINGHDFVMYGFNGQQPGPLIRVQERTTVVVDFTNRIELPTTVHWHGVRLDNRYDGVPGVTQEAVPPGGRFVYHVFFPDPGIYWYHPHVREDIEQELGLYGNMLVESRDPEYFNAVNREEVLILDDLMVDRDRIVPFGRETANFTLMGRFGTVFLLNGEPAYNLTVRRGDVVRFLLTNVSNTRIYNLVFGDAPLKVVGADIGRFEREEWVQSVVIAPAQRYIVEARFERPGRWPITNRVQAIDHFLGEFYPSVDTLGTVTVTDEPAVPDRSAAFGTLHGYEDVVRDVDRYRPYLDRAPDRELLMTVEVGNVPQDMIQLMAVDTAYYPPVEWSNAMPMMNWVTNGTNLRWILRDRATGAENMNIDWTFARGDIVKIRLYNDPDALHPMSHPVHLHGQRFLVVARNGVRTRNFVWKDTVLVPVGATVDILLDVTNPGRWMLHCHIAEHLEAGMMTAFTVTPD